MKKTLDIDKIRIDGGTQPREVINQDTVSEYAESIALGAKFPNPVVFFDGKDYWLSDGFHRYHAYIKLGSSKIPCDVKNGSVRDAILFSVGANVTHGMRRTNADKRRAVLTLLNDKEWRKWSDRKIAEKCAVTHPFVSEIRKLPSGNRYQIESRTVERGGEIYEMLTANIGKRTATGDAEILRLAREIKTERAKERISKMEAQNASALLSNPVLDGKRYRLFVSDIQSLKLEPRSIDAIITDAPYPHEYLPLYGSLSRLASEVLKYNGICVVMTGQSYLEEVLEQLGLYLTYQWTLAYLTPGSSVQVFGRRIKSNWKPLIFLTNGENNWEHVDDTIISDKRDKQYHEWGQSVGGMVGIVEKFTVKNSVILDPFCGAGTTGVASLITGRTFVGSDIDETEIKKAADRLSKIGDTDGDK